MPAHPLIQAFGIDKATNNLCDMSGNPCISWDDMRSEPHLTDEQLDEMYLEHAWSVHEPNTTPLI